MVLPVRNKIFFAYASQPAARAEAMRDAIAELGAYGSQASGWETLQIQGNLLIEAICAAIGQAEVVVAEVSSMNPNVLFEAGFAVAKGAHVCFAIDDTDTEAVRLWDGIGLIATVGRIDYGGNAGKLARKVYEAASVDTPTLVDQLLADARPREANAVFSPTVPHRYNAADRLDRHLERKRGLKLLGHGDDLGLAPLSYYAQEIYRSSAAVFQLMGPNRSRSAEHNARASLLAGMAHGWGLPLLMVAEEGFRSPLDYKDLLYVYATAADVMKKVDEWLAAVPPAPRTARRLGQVRLDVELPLRSFGQYVAESEASELDGYFISTNEFEAVLSARSQVFTGRKGTGKTAAMLQSVEQLRRDRRNLVVPIKPSSYDLAALLALLRRFQRGPTLDYLLLNLWSYLITVEIAKSVLDRAEERAAGIGGSHSIGELASVLDDLHVSREDDLSAGLDDIVAEVQPETDLTESLRVRWHDRLQRALVKALSDFDRVAVVIDNLDKTWERGQDFEMLSQFILSLLVTAGKLEHAFSRRAGKSPVARLTLAIFLRTDIYDYIIEYAREPDKISPQSVSWHDEELLVRVLEERYEANRKDRARSAMPDMWKEVFCSEVNGLPARDYMLWRALPRPRDIIFLANAALTTAINRRHTLIESSDLVFAEKEYSRFATAALLVETEAQGFDLEEALYEFAGQSSTLKESELLASLGSSGDPKRIRDWLIRTSFLGLETSQGAFVHIEGESEARRKLIAAERVAKAQGRELRYRIHPAFRPHLDVRDDDLHSLEITDATLHVSGELPPDGGVGR